MLLVLATDRVDLLLEFINGRGIEVVVCFMLGILGSTECKMVKQLRRSEVDFVNLANVVFDLI